MQLNRLQRVPAGSHMPRHRHAAPYAAVVLAGGYLEAGDAGRHRATAGCVLLHEPWSGHLNEIAVNGARVLNLALPLAPRLPAFGRLKDPDAIARTAERHPHLAAQMLLQLLEPVPSDCIDWPDLLAQQLRDDPQISITDWSRRHRLAPATVSRGFRAAFGVSPKRYRLDARALSALRQLIATEQAGSRVAHDTGFSDQAHMVRTIVDLTGLSPDAIRRTSTSFNPGRSRSF